MSGEIFQETLITSMLKLVYCCGCLFFTLLLESSE